MIPPPNPLASTAWLAAFAVILGGLIVLMSVLQRRDTRRCKWALKRPDGSSVCGNDSCDLYYGRTCCRYYDPTAPCAGFKPAEGQGDG